jgi:hypothetical protein
VRCAALLAALIVLAACGGGAPIASCDDDLRGVYAAGDRRWMVIDRGATLEAYPLFPDGDGPPELPALVAAPRVIDLARGGADGAPLTGVLRRRYMRRAERCDAQLPVQVTRCAGDTLEIVLADPAPPISFAPCAWTQPGPSRVERWRRGG